MPSLGQNIVFWFKLGQARNFYLYFGQGRDCSHMDLKNQARTDLLLRGVRTKSFMNTNKFLKFDFLHQFSKIMHLFDTKQTQTLSYIKSKKTIFKTFLNTKTSKTFIGQIFKQTIDHFNDSWMKKSACCKFHSFNKIIPSSFQRNYNKQVRKQHSF